MEHTQPVSEDAAPPVLSEDAAPHVSPPSTPAPDNPRVAFILSCLSSATGKSLTPGELNRKLSTKAAEAVGLSKEAAPPILEQCVNDGHARKETEKRSVKYHITEAGETHLATLGDLIKTPTGIRGKIIPPANDEVRQHRVSYLLLKVLESSQGKLPESQASDCLDTYGREGLEFNTATVKHLLRELAAQEMLTQSSTGKSIEFTIAPAGTIRLGNAEFPDKHSFTFKGNTLNVLLEAARTVGKQFAPQTVEQPKPITRADVEGTILAAFEELRRERFAVSGLVPIHEVRAEVRKQHGDAAARHDMFDDVVLGLWREKKVRLTPISDSENASAQQLQDSIPGRGEILFYLEVVHELAPI